MARGDDNPVVSRRIHVHDLRAGDTVELDPREAHHARDVLRLTDGTCVEVFDDAGAVGDGVLVFDGPRVSVRVERADVTSGTHDGVRLTIVAAVPKGDRADWMVEKLSELGVAEFVPLAAARSVVLPEGRGKRDRWLRIATEAAKQSRRTGVMRITELTRLADALRGAAAAGRRLWFLSTESERPTPASTAVRDLPAGEAVTAFIGPEGGWTPQEVEQFLSAGATAVRLTPTVLRIETAAVTTAAVVSCLAWNGAPAGPLDGRAAQVDDPSADAPKHTGTTP